MLNVGAGGKTLLVAKPKNKVTPAKGVSALKFSMTFALNLAVMTLYMYII